MKKISKNTGLLAKNFLKLGLVMFVILMIVSFIIYQNAINTMNNELQYQNKITTKKVQTLADNVFREIELIIADIQTNSSVGLYIAGGESYDLQSDLYYRVSEKVSNYGIIYKYINSVYIYSEKEDRLFTSSNQKASTFSDNVWLDTYKQSNDRMTIWGRKINNVYPPVVTFMKKVSKYNSDGAIVVNVNMKELGKLLGDFGEPNQKINIISDDKIVFYDKNNNDILKNISEISAFSQEKNDISTEIHSDYYNWSYRVTTKIKNYNSNLASTRGYVMLIILILFVVFVVITIFIVVGSYKPVQSIMNVLDMPENWSDKKIENSSTEVKYIVDKIMTTVNENNALHSELENRLKMLNTVNIKALQAQLNPHFLANTLNLINLIMVSEVGKEHPCSRMLDDLSKLLRYTLVMNDNIVELFVEIKYAHLCVNILKERYEDLFVEEWDIQENTLNSKILKLGLQPIIENAIYHAIVPKGSNGILKISSKRENDKIMVSVSDNGVGMSEEKLSQIIGDLNYDVTLDSSHVGIKNVHQRIKLIFGEKYGITIQSKENVGTVVTLVLPT